MRATAAGLGLTATTIPFTLRDMLDSMGQDAGFADWADLAAATASAASIEDTESLQEKVLSSRAMRPATAIATTAADMARLLALIWRDEAGPAEACAQVRGLMARQVTRHRLAMGFARDVRVAAKSGSLAGVVRNEIGGVETPDGRRFAAAVFTRAHRPWLNENKINRTIGAAASLAVERLSEAASPGAY